MSKREKIMVMASVGAFFWGLVMLVGTLDTKNGRPLAVVEDIDVFITTIRATVNEDPSQGLDDIVLSRARQVWGKDPFSLSGPVNFDPRETFHYQGYVRSGSRMFALINNREYALGEDMDGRGIRLRAITPDRVVLVEQGKRKRVLPIEGDL